MYIELVEGKNYLVPDSVFTVVVKGQFALLQDRPAIGNALHQSIHGTIFQEKMLKNKFDLNDYLENMQQVRNMGPIDKLLGMLPGVDQSKLKDVDIDEKQIAHVEAIIRSMTMKERSRPEILNASRKRRIAAGSGRPVEEINKLLKGFDQAKEMMKRFGGRSPMMHKKKKKRK